MADALISPVVGGAAWAASLGLAAYSARKIAPEEAERKAPLMGVAGAFVFAAQMINFTIPLTGSSGHLGGGMILAIILGRHAAFLVMFSILAVQALFFADGGLLAMGCNVFNLGFWPCFVAYPLIFRKIAGGRPTAGRVAAGAMLAGIVSLQLGAFGVVLETLFSGISDLPFGAFVLLMQPIHLAIGVVEGLVTGALVVFLQRARPEVLDLAPAAPSASRRPLVAGLAAAAVLVGGLVSWFASTHPDGLEWAMARTSGHEELAAPEDGVHGFAARVQRETAFLPDYDLPAEEPAGAPGGEKAGPPAGAGAARWPAVNAGTSLAGLLGAGLVLLLAGLTGFVLRLGRRSSPG